MPEEHNNSTEQTASNPATGTPRPHGRSPLRIGVIVIVVVAILGLILFYAPQYVARYLIASELDKLGIAHEGIDSLDINPWTGEAWLGPVRFGAGPSDRGQLGELGLDIRFNPLLDRRVSIERLLVRGIDVVVIRGENNAIALNGIPIEQIIPPPAAANQPAEEDADWGAGLDVLELRDSRLIFEDRDRGDLEVEIERLMMTEFRTWEPDRPGRFELAANVNDIQLNWSGEVRPFADKITLTIDSRTEQADVPKVIRFTGPLGLDRREGTYDAQLKYDVTLTESGHVEGHTVGVIDIKGADYQRAGAFALALERAKVDVDVRYTLSESGDFALQGQVATDLGASSATVVDETSFGAKTGRIAISGLNATYAKDGTFKVAARADVNLEGVAFSGPIEISVEQVLELLALLQSISAGTAVSTADTGLGDYAGASVAIPSSDVKVGRLQSQGESFTLQSARGKVELGMKADSDLFDIQIGVGERTIRIERLQSVLQQLSLTSGQGRLVLDMAGTNSLVAGTSVSPIGELNIGAFESKTDNLDLEVQTGAVSLQFATATSANGVSALINAREGRPEMQLHLGAASASLSQASIDAIGEELHWQLAGGAAVDSLTAEFAKGKEGALKFGRAEIKALQGNESSQFEADAFTVDGLDLYVRRSLLEALFQDGETSPAKADTAKTAAATPVPLPASKPVTQEVDVRRVQKLLTDLGYKPGPVDGKMGQRTAAAIEAFQRREGLTVDGRSTASLLAALETQAAGSADRVTAPAPKTDVAQPAGLSVRLGQLALTGSPVIRFRDDIVTPNVSVDAVFNEAQIRNFDTRKTKQRTDVRVAADVNEFTQVELTGWINGFSENADLDLNAKVENLELSNYSPYIEELAGVYLESGRLDTTSACKAAQGGLQGEMQLELEKIAFRPLSKEDAERVTAKVGVPLETAVNLLQDNDGRILLKLPVTGRLSDPSVDISSAVNKAIGGALKKVFPPTMVASLLSGVSKGGGVAFDPIVFAPGSAELDGAGKGYADDLAEFLAEHPKLSLNVCGRSTAQDVGKVTTTAGAAEPSTKEAKSTSDAAKSAQAKAKLGPPPQQAAGTPQDAQQLKELAIERKRAVRRYLIKEKSVDAKRVGECRSSFEAADQGSPRVEISL